MLSDTTIGVIGARGGQGTSTIATVLALYASSEGPTGLIGPDPADLLALLGRSASSDDEPVPVSDTLTIVSRPPAGSALDIVDCGSLRHPASTLPANLVAVVRGPCYLALRSLVASGASGLEGLIIVHEAHRSISPADALEATGLPLLASVPVTDRVARLIDAGLLCARATALPEFAPLRAVAARFDALSGADQAADVGQRLVRHRRVLRVTCPLPLRPDVPPEDATIVLRAGVMSGDNMTRAAQRTLALYSAYGISVEGVIDTTVQEACRFDRIASYRRVRLSTFGRLREAGFALLATFDSPHFTRILADLSELALARLDRCFDTPIPNPGRPTGE